MVRLSEDLVSYNTRFISMVRLSEDLVSYKTRFISMVRLMKILCHTTRVLYQWSG
jgi:hypothetical protein